MRNTSRFALVAFTATFLAACGGGSDQPLTGGAKKPTIEILEWPRELPAQEESEFSPYWADSWTTPHRRHRGAIVANVKDSAGRTVSNGVVLEGPDGVTGPEDHFVNFSIRPVGPGAGELAYGALYTWQLGGPLGANNPSLSDQDVILDLTLPSGDQTEVRKPLPWLNAPPSGGRAQVMFMAYEHVGEVEITASYTDPLTNQTAETSKIIKITSPVATGLPDTFVVDVLDLPIYTANQNRNDRARLQVYLTDPSGQPVRNPGEGVNNIKAEIIGESLGAQLVGSNGRGETVYSRTIGSTGRADLSLVSGTSSGTVTIRFTADAADNDVDNGIAQPITKDVSVFISDGVIESISFTGPFIDGVRAGEAWGVPFAPGEVLKDGVYHRLVSAIAIDRQGNPVPNARIRFGLIDSPLARESFPSIDFSPMPPTQEAAGTIFAMQGDRGNPVEGGNRFDHQDNVNLISEGAKRFDRIILFPDEQGTQRELISHRLINQVLDQNTLTTVEPFPFPRAEGFTDGFNIPWVAGRAQYGNIATTALTDESGVAHTYLTYPATRLGQLAFLAAESVDDRTTGVMIIRYEADGSEELTLTSSHTQVPPSGTTNITMCVRNQAGAPLGNEVISALDLTDGISISPTSLSTEMTTGCVNFDMITDRAPGSPAHTVTFSVRDGEAEAEIRVEAYEEGELIASVSGPAGGDAADCANAQTRDITATALNASSNPVSGVLVSFEFAPAVQICSGTPVTATTGANGEATVTVEYTGTAGDVINVDMSANGFDDASTTFVVQ